MAYDPLEENVDVKKLLGKLYFVEEDVATANLEQPKLMYSVCRYRVQLMRTRMQLEARLKLTRAKAAYKYRKIKRDGKALTEAAVREKLDTNTEVTSAEKKLDAAVVDEELSKQLFEVFKQRQIAINNIIKSRSNEVARALWDLEHNAKHERLKDAAKIIRGKYHKDKEEESD